MCPVSLSLSNSLSLSLQDLEEKKKEPQRIEPTPSAALITGLTQQMNDVVFKLQTLTSRITLLENRVTMVEAQASQEIIFGDQCCFLGGGGLYYIDSFLQNWVTNLPVPGPSDGAG